MIVGFIMNKLISLLCCQYLYFFTIYGQRWKCLTLKIQKVVIFWIRSSTCVGSFYLKPYILLWAINNIYSQPAWLNKYTQPIKPSLHLHSLPSRSLAPIYESARLRTKPITPLATPSVPWSHDEYNSSFCFRDGSSVTWRKKTLISLLVRGWVQAPPLLMC